MQKLHLVGLTPEHDGLILSTRKGAKSGKFVVAVDASVLKQLSETAAATSTTTESRSNGARPAARGPRSSRPESLLSPREMQELLRGGWTSEEVAAEAGVDVDWVNRFAAPVLAEMQRVLDQARECYYEKPRVGVSALPLAASVRRNIAERGVRFLDEEFDDGWRAYQLDEELWVIEFEYRSRGREQLAEWTFDLEEGELTSRGRLGTQLGYVQSARRRVSADAPPKPKAKKSGARGTKTQASSQAARRPSARTVPARVMVPRVTVTAVRAPVPVRSVPVPVTRAEPVAPRPDPWREELQRRARETAAAERRAAEVDKAEADDEAEDDRPVALVGPTVRTLTRTRPAQRAPEPLLPDRDEPWPDVDADLEWAQHTRGPLPAPGPLPVPDSVRERVAHPLGTTEADDEPDLFSAAGGGNEPDLFEDLAEDDAPEDDEPEDDETQDVADEAEPDEEVLEAEADEDDDVLLAEIEELVAEAPEPVWREPSPAAVTRRQQVPVFRGTQPAVPAVRRRRRTEPLRAR